MIDPFYLQIPLSIVSTSSKNQSRRTCVRIVHQYIQPSMANILNRAEKIRNFLVARYVCIEDLDIFFGQVIARFVG